MYHGYAQRAASAVLVFVLTAGGGCFVDDLEVLTTAVQQFLSKKDGSRGNGPPAHAESGRRHLFPPQILATSPLPEAAQGEAYSFQFECVGGRGPSSWSVTGGSPPGNLLLSAEGLLSGVPATAGAYTFTVTVSDDAGTDSGEFAMVVNALPPVPPVPPAITTTSPLLDATQGAAYWLQFGYTAGSGSATWSVTGGTLPEGLTLTADGLLSGTPSAAGAYTFTVTVTDDAGADNGDFSLAVTAAPLPGPSAPVITSTSPLPDATQGEAYSYQFEHSGGLGLAAWSVTGGTLPSGLTLSAGGLLSGSLASAGAYTFTVRVADDTGSDSREFSVSVNPQGEVGTFANRTTGVAPLAVFFDAVNASNLAYNSGVVQPGDLDYASFQYEWDFGDPSSGNWPTNGRSKNGDSGYVAAHVYENAGMYNVTLTVIDSMGGTHVYTQQITVTAFSGTTYYISNSDGNDGNDGLSTGTAWKTFAKAIA
ncbi:MAG: putative Ig domain-containing protein, partial [Planctomycetes bacterium]|nr:putative Ig domain-containing protein [Planctomycetota bacterium]